MLRNHLKYRGIGLLLLLWIGWQLPAHAQGPYRDYQTWTWFQVEKQFTKHYSVSVQYQLRTDNTNGAFQWSYFYLNGEYKFNKNFNTQVVYEYCTSYQNDVHSFYWGITGKYGLGRWKAGLRTAIQNEVVHFNPQYSDEVGNETKYEWRNRVSLRYKLFSNITPFIFSEPYLRVGYREPYMDKMRNGFGVDYDMNKYNSFSIYYLYQPLFDITQYKIENIIGIVYSITFPHKKIHWNKFFKPKKTLIIEDGDDEKDNNVLDKS